MAFFVVREHNVAQKKLQLVVGSIGEPDNLNPIISQSVSAGEVEGFLFDALVKYDENLNIVPSLAREFHITQDSTAFFASSAQARKAFEQINSAKAQWSNMKLTSCTT